MQKRFIALKIHLQYAALPYRRCSDGASFEIMLVTSRETQRWVIPKGWPMRGYKGCQAAAREAFEEAGLKGEIAKQPIGTYTYAKRLKDRSSVTCSVQVYPLAVAKQRERWPEMAEREARWFSLEKAMQAVEEPDLAELMRKLGEFIVGQAAS